MEVVLASPNKLVAKLPSKPSKPTKPEEENTDIGNEIGEFFK